MLGIHQLTIAYMDDMKWFFQFVSVYVMHEQNKKKLFGWDNSKEVSVLDFLYELVKIKGEEFMKFTFKQYI